MIRFLLAALAVLACLATGVPSAEGASSGGADSVFAARADNDGPPDPWIPDPGAADPTDPLAPVEPSAPSTADAPQEAPPEPTQEPEEASGKQPKESPGTGHFDPWTSPLPTQGDLSAFGARIFHGWGFDACSAPDLQTMRAWLGHSRYGAVGVYIGGRGRSCGQPRLSRTWMREVSGMGWRILPVYVGSQSPCATRRQHRRHPIDPRRAAAQGRAEAADALRAATGLGIAPRSPVYLDVESYYPHTRRCAEPVVDFTQAWSRGMRAADYLPGFYSSSNSGIVEIEAARRAGRTDLPDVIWFARWGRRPDVYGEPALNRAAWRPHRRIHQFAGDTLERHAGRALRIDRDLIDAPVAIVVPQRWW